MRNSFSPKKIISTPGVRNRPHPSTPLRVKIELPSCRAKTRPSTLPPGHRPDICAFGLVQLDSESRPIRQLQHPVNGPGLVLLEIVVAFHLLNKVHGRYRPVPMESHKSSFHFAQIQL